MSNFNPQKLSVKYIPPANDLNPIDGRKYTLTHSDVTGELFLSVGYEYDYSAIDVKMRDEVLAKLQKNAENNYMLFGKAYVSGGEFGLANSAIRFNIFQKEMYTALKGIVYGDREFYFNHPELLNIPIYIYYQSIYPQFNQIIYYGTPQSLLDSI